MATNVFVSFRFSDGYELKEELCSMFDSSTDVINRSEDEDRSEMSKETIRNYLYDKLKSTSITIVLLTPDAIEYRKDVYGNYDDWLYDELRYSLDDRKNNRMNGAIALYTDDSKHLLKQNSIHTCSVCNEEKNCMVVVNNNNLVYKNMLNIKDQHKYNKCEDLYDSNRDSYISLIHFNEFKDNYKKYIDFAKDKRERSEEFDIVKRL